MASSSTSTTEGGWKYDVFLSFRGEDTRQSFTSHLYMVLVHAGIRTFIDEEELRKGENLAPALFEAIRGSRISLIVFSSDYASSRWCLDELVQIMECRKTLGQLVRPIFRHTEPSDVRYQKGSYGEAFQRHEARQTQDKISRWRYALTEAANISGWVLEDGTREAQLIEDIVHEITVLLNDTYLHVTDYPVGIDSRVENISQSLCVGVDDDVRMVGIWGMGGSGKSSVAKAIYNKFLLSFENKSFLGSVRETANASNGKITLQEKLLSDILKPSKKIEVGDADRGIIVIKRSLRSKKVLLIVDDVDNRDQLTALAISHDSFGPGSRIVITTRDRRLLDLLNVDAVHPTQEMEEEEAMELLSWHAFQNPCIDSRFLELSRRVVTYCSGLPLAIEVLGSFLSKASKKKWKRTLKKLEKFPDDKIHGILKISYDALDENQRNIFLHIACFFVGMDKKYVTQILHGCDYASDEGICDLLQRCLVTVSEKNKLMMHDLLRDMGREVVRSESPKRPEKRSRLWSEEDVEDVLTERSGTITIEGLALNLQRSDTKRFETKAFRKMKRLKLLQLNYVQLDGEYKYLSKKLRWLCWRGFSLSTIRNEFLNEQNLVSIDLRYSKLKQVWEQSRSLTKLKILNLSHSHDLTHTPNFLNLPNLKYLIMKDCRSLSEIDESIGHLKRLRLVNLKDCIMLRDLPKSFYKLESVETLVLSGCEEFQNLSDDMGNMKSLTTLLVSGTAISQLPSCVQKLDLNFSSLQDLTRVKVRFPDVPRYQSPTPEGIISLNTGSSNVHSLPERPASDLPCRSKDLESDHCTALAIIPNSSETSMQSNESILQGWTVNGEGGALSSDFIWLRDLPTSLMDLAHHYTNEMEIVPSFSETSRQSILQEWPANDFPGQFTYVRESARIIFLVPQVIDCNLKALTVCVVCSLCSSENISPNRNSIFVTNQTKLARFVVRPASPTARTSDEVIWQGNLSINQLNLEGGDFVEVEVVTGSGLKVKRTGVNLIWDPNLIIGNTIESERIPYQYLPSDADNDAGPSHDSSDENGFQNALKFCVFVFFSFKLFGEVRNAFGY